MIKSDNSILPISSANCSGERHIFNLDVVEFKYKHNREIL